MTDFFKADVFFFITTIAIALVAIGVAIALIYLIQILRDVKELSGKAKREGEAILDDVRDMRHEMKGYSFQLSRLLSWVGFVRSKKVAKKDQDAV